MRKLLIAPATIGAILVSVWPAHGMDCRRAGTAVERMICGDASLRGQDARMGQEYAALRTDAAPDVAAQLAQQQRQWLRSRDAACHPLTTACLSSVYDRRLEQFAALQSDVDTSADGRLSGVTAVILRGTWIAGALSPRPDAPDFTPASLLTELHQAGLPAAGETVKATPEGLCVADGPCEPVSWRRGLLKQQEGDIRLEHDLALSPEQPVLVGYRSGKWQTPIMVLAGQAGPTGAIAQLCSPVDHRCVNAIQSWTSSR